MRKGYSISLLSLLLLVGASTLLTACNTVEGAGKDVSKAGNAISGEAAEHK